MVKITEIFKQQQRTFSFEFFPPKDEISAVEFGINVGILIKLNPSFVTVTYGAGGSTRDRTFDLVDFLHNKMNMPCIAHYTCVNATREAIMDDMRYFEGHGIENLMLLRGDPPKGQGKFEPLPDGFRYASELIGFVDQHFDFCIGAAAYPEVHPEAKNPDVDLQNLKKKIEAGADFVTTQMFFINDFYFDFVEKARNIGITERVIPGIIPITNYPQIKRFVGMSNASLPDKLVDKLESYKDDDAKIRQIGLDFAIDQCRDLLKRGAPGIHFYTLNKSHAAVEIYESLSKEIPEIKDYYENGFGK